MTPDPAASAQRLTFHHIGIPVPDVMPGMVHAPELRMHALGYFDAPYAIEWMRFDDDNTLPQLIKEQIHVAYVVDDLHSALKGRQVVLEPATPSVGVTTAFIRDGNALIELLQFDRPEHEVWPHPGKFLLPTLR